MHEGVTWETYAQAGVRDWTYSESSGYATRGVGLWSYTNVLGYSEVGANPYTSHPERGSIGVRGYADSVLIGGTARVYADDADPVAVCDPWTGCVVLP